MDSTLAAAVPQKKLDVSRYVPPLTLDPSPHPMGRGKPHRQVPIQFHSKRGKFQNQIHLASAAFAILAAVMVAALGSSAADAPKLTPVADPRPVLEDLQRKMSTLTSVYLEFSQERQLKLFAEPLKSEGVMLIDRPDRIRWETTAPYESILLGNHKSVAQFERTDGAWQKLKLGFPQMLKRVMEQMTLMHQGRLDALTKDFTISVSTGSVAVVTMIPKDENVRALLASLEITMAADFSATREVVMNEPGGDLTRIIFRREKRGVKIPEAAFDQTKPLDLAAIKKIADASP